VTKFDVFHFGTFFFFVMLKLVDGFDNSWFSSKDIIGICRPIQIQFNIVSPNMH